MNHLDRHYSAWANDRTMPNLNTLMQAVTEALHGDTYDSAYVAQEVCYRVWQGLEKFKHKGADSFKKWVSTLARFERLTLQRNKTRELESRIYFDDDGEDVEDGLSGSEKFETAITMHKLKRQESIDSSNRPAILKALWLTEHPDKFISAYAEDVLDEKTNTEIAAEMGMSNHALECKLNRVRNKLKRK